MRGFGRGRLSRNTTAAGGCQHLETQLCQCYVTLTAVAEPTPLMVTRTVEHGSEMVPSTSHVHSVFP
jgi:hypothetical protein